MKRTALSAILALAMCASSTAAFATPAAAPSDVQAAVHDLARTIMAAAQAAETDAKARGLSEADTKAAIEVAVLEAIAQSGAVGSTVTAALAEAKANPCLLTDQDRRQPPAVCASGVVTAALAAAEQVVASAQTSGPAANGPGANGRANGTPPLAPPVNNVGGYSGYRPNN